jgi:hypothetical protein
MTGDGLHRRLMWNRRDTACQAHHRRPCHQRAIHTGRDRSRADKQGQRHGALDLRRSLPSQVMIPPDLALQAEGRGLGRCRAAPWRLAYEQVVTKDESHPPAELVTIAGRLRATSPSPAVPPTCPKHRSAAVSHGQPRSVRVPAEL